MPKRKSVRKQKARQSASDKSRPKTAESAAAMPVPAVALKVLAIVLGVILIIALTLYVSGRMPGQGFWTLAILLAVIAFVIMPVIRKKYVRE
ncbi:hypothetical protein KY362_02890 [Candidatus Woesearchaeota archaeon]|nr:hypothetical protein [Candidatus Woesearchaeota archaeon]